VLFLGVMLFYVVISSLQLWRLPKRIFGALSPVPA